MSEPPDDDPLNPQRKRQRKSVNLKVKLDILKRFDAGHRGVDIAKAYSLPATTVRSIVAKADTIRKFAKSAVSLSATKLTRQRSNLMSNMESQLTQWLETRNESSLPTTRSQIQERARILYEDLRPLYENEEDVEPFIASRGWLDRFKKRSVIYSTKEEEEEHMEDEDAPLPPIIELTEYRNESPSNIRMIKHKKKRRILTNRLTDDGDEFDAIAVSIAAKLRKVNDRDENQRYYCEKIINEALFKALMNKLTETSEIVDSAENIY